MSVWCMFALPRRQVIRRALPRDATPARLREALEMIEHARGHCFPSSATLERVDADADEPGDQIEGNVVIELAHDHIIDRGARLVGFFDEMSDCPADPRCAPKQSDVAWIDRCECGRESRTAGIVGIRNDRLGVRAKKSAIGKLVERSR